MSDHRSARAFPKAMSALTPEAVAETVRLVMPSGIIAVQGFAKNVSEPRAYGDSRPIVYGELVLGSALVAFQVPVEAAPLENEPVIIEGHLRVRLVTRSGGDVWRGNWKVTLVGQVVGNWTPRAAPKPITPLPERSERLPLSDFVLRYGVDSLLVLSSQNGRKDLAQSLASANRSERPGFAEANFGDADAFLQVLTAIPAGGEVCGVALARGGGQGLDVIGGSREIVAALIEKRMPFYTALGHDTDLVLVDRSADQVFHTPSELGAAIARAANNADAWAERTRRLNTQAGMIDRQSAQLDGQAQRIADLQADAARTSSAATTREVTLRNLLIGAILALAFTVWMLVR